MRPELRLLSPAKLNLFLHVTGQRSDGYHSLQTLFQLLDWGDELAFSVDSSGEISLAGDSLDIPPEQNLIAFPVVHALNQVCNGRGLIARRFELRFNGQRHRLANAI